MHSRWGGRPDSRVVDNAQPGAQKDTGYNGGDRRNRTEVTVTTVPASV